MILAGGFQSREGGSEKRYATEEERLCTLLSQVDGVGRVSVMITYYEEKDGSWDASKQNTGAKGVVIAAEGAENEHVKNEIISGVRAVLNLPANKVYVYKMAQESGNRR